MIAIDAGYQGNGIGHVLLPLVLVLSDLEGWSDGLALLPAQRTLVQMKLGLKLKKKIKSKNLISDDQLSTSRRQ